jgi:hypothetical protein
MDVLLEEEEGVKTKGDQVAAPELRKVKVS